MPDVICLGELLIDFCAAERDVTLAEARTFVKAPGRGAGQRGGGGRGNCRRRS